MQRCTVTDKGTSHCLTRYGARFATYQWKATTMKTVVQLCSMCHITIVFVPAIEFTHLALVKRAHHSSLAGHLGVPQSLTFSLQKSISCYDRITSIKS